MGLSLGERVRSSVAALMHATGESQADVAVALGVSQAQVSRRQSGTAAWSLADCDALAAHFGIDVLDLLAGPTRACETLPVRKRRPGGPKAVAR
ncbi:helix-turn-helix domain-containing protein [Streptomyces justiciae]|uniref:Helix-turn-helix transcriptional regulator n=1 Tax=Streptomyces justiciae TaxID=2780140 RepID=A0ABU3LMZ2_9ACTN|nr:helix-turn-helix transcriptional regulator [Streptomyces justiciae]MCW8380517.1 helix-turn-helix domain-containing protein [Streptomyces justiciae]MDT7840591.1 helix-turn-helix transcriptional regulator [Streptomyces justiciae]